MNDIDLLRDDEVQLTDEILDRKKKRLTIISVTIGIICTIIFLGILIYLNFIYSNDRKGDFGQIEKVLEKFFSSNSFEIDGVLTIEKDNYKNEYVNKIVKKDINMSLLSKKIDEENYNTGAYLNQERLELYLNEDKTTYLKFKDIFKTLETYNPKLSELSHDLSKISYSRYTNELKKDTMTFMKDFKLTEYYKFLGDKLIDYLYIENNEETLDTTYKIIVPRREMIKIKIELLNKIKEDKKIRLLIEELDGDFFDNIYKSKDYEKIKMTKDEFNHMRLTYEGEALKIFDEKLEVLKSKYETLYSLSNIDDEDSYIIVVDKNKNIKNIITNSEILMNNELYEMTYNKEFKNINNVKSIDIVPNVKERINLVKITRSDLYELVENIKDKYKNFTKYIR